MKKVITLGYITILTIWSALLSPLVKAIEPVNNIEISPSYFLMKGYGVDYLYNVSKKHSIGAGIAYAEFNKALNDIFFNNDNKVSDLSWKISPALHYRYNINTKKSHSFFLGLSRAKEEWGFTEKSNSNKVKIKNNLIATSLGHKYVFNSNGYITTQLIFLKNNKIKQSGSNTPYLKEQSFIGNITLGFSF